MAEQRLPTVNGDDGSWGDILNQFLAKEHYNTGADNTVNGGHQHITLRAGTTTAGTAPLYFTAGSNLAAAFSGAMEYDGTKYYLTNNTLTRKTIAFYDDSSGATGDMYYRNFSGDFTRIASVGAQNQILSMGASSVPTWVDNTATIHQQTMARISLGF